MLKSVQNNKRRVKLVPRIDKADKALIGQYGVYQVASLLCWKGFNAVPTSRNTKAVDLLVHDPKSGKSVGVQVKTTHQKNKDCTKDGYWVMNVKPKDLDKKSGSFLVPFVFVYVPEAEEPSPRFFIVPAHKVYDLCNEYWNNYKSESKDKTARKLIPLGPKVAQLLPYQDKWENLGLI